MSHSKKEMISLFLTTRCNLKCRYCYTNKVKHKHQIIDLEFAKLGIDEYFRTNKPKHIRFFGAGEPTVEFNLMKQIREYAYQKAGDNLIVETQTNGTFSTQVAEWLAEYLDIIWISCDGLPKVQDYYRRTIVNGPTSRILEGNTKYLTKNGKGMTGIRSTITSKNVGSQKENIQYFSELGVRYVWSDPVFPTVGEKEPLDKCDLMEYVHEFLKAKEFADEIGVFYGSILTCNFDEKTKYHCRACLPVPHLTTDGYVSACDMALFGKDKNHMSVFIYGKWDKDNNRIVYDEDKIRTLRSRSSDNMPSCKGCEAQHYCAGYCLGEVTNETGDMFGQKKRVCEPIRFLSRNMPLNEGRYKYFHP